ATLARLPQVSMLHQRLRSPRELDSSSAPQLGSLQRVSRFASAVKRRIASSAIRARASLRGASVTHRAPPVDARRRPPSGPSARLIHPIERGGWPALSVGWLTGLGSGMRRRSHGGGMTRKIFFVVAIAIVLASPSKAMAQNKNKLVGTWKLVSAVSKTEQGEVNNAAYGEHPKGFITYTSEGRMIVV